MRRRPLTRGLTSVRTAAGLIAVTLGALPMTAQAAPCAGMTRMQLRWSQSTGTALVSLSAVQCDRPPNCSASAARSDNAMFTKSPITVTIKDASGHSLSGVVDAGAANCSGRCRRSNRGGCVGGADTHRLAGSAVRYAVNTQGQTTVVANKLKLAATERPNLVAPITVSITDANGYAVTAELRNCRTRTSANGVAITCA